jgi:hypothetical protein
VVFNLDDPISPYFARSFVVDTSSENVARDTVDLLAEELLKVPARVWREAFAERLRYDPPSPWRSPPRHAERAACGA